MADAATRLGVAIRWEEGHFRGGQCTVAGESVVILNKRHPAEVQVTILTDVLRDLPLDSIYLRPALREHIHILLAKD